MTGERKPARRIPYLNAKVIVSDATVVAIAILSVMAKTAEENPTIENIQAFYSELRNVNSSIPAGLWVAFQEAADRVETDPGIVPVPNEQWRKWKARLNDPTPGMGPPKSKDESHIQFLFRKILVLRQKAPPYGCPPEVMADWIETHDGLEEIIGGLPPDGPHDAEIKQALHCDQPTNFAR